MRRNRGITAVEAGGYVVAQVAGAILAGGLLELLTSGFGGIKDQTLSAGTINTLAALSELNRYWTTPPLHFRDVDPMGDAILVIVVLLVVAFGTVFLLNQRAAQRQRELDDAKADARRWVERLGGQVLNLTGNDIASQQALADASERYTAAGSQIEQAQTVRQAKLATDTALEGLYYVRAARTAMGMDQGPALPDDAERARAGKVTEQRGVDVEGHRYVASPDPSQSTPHYYPGGRVAGRPVPEGWYSEPWWKPALVAGAWGLGSMFLFSAMFSGMSGIPDAQAWESGFDAGQQEALESGGHDGGDGGDFGGDHGGDYGGGDYGGGDFGGGFGDFGGGGDFGGF